VRRSLANFALSLKTSLSRDVSFLKKTGANMNVRLNALGSVALLSLLSLIGITSAIAGNPPNKFCS
jgi:hypothetical protein